MAADGSAQVSTSEGDLFGMAIMPMCPRCDQRLHPSAAEEYVAGLLENRGPSYTDRLVDLLKATPSGRRALKAIAERV